MAFEINYLIGNLDTYFRQDEINVLLFYAKDINLNLTKKLNYLLDKKVSYMIQHNISTSGLDSNDKMHSYFNLSDMQLFIQFVLTQLIPAMQNENTDMDVKYGGSISNLIIQVNNYNSNDSGFTLNINYDYVPVEMTYYIDMVIEIKDLLQKSIDLNTPILVSYTD